MILTHHINHVQFENNHLIIEVDDKLFSFDLKLISARLYNATETERNLYHISPSGYGIHWPLIDEDLSIDVLIKSQN
jgi:hypothetical protein